MSEQQVVAAHVALCNWSRELMLAILRSEGLEVEAICASIGYTWEHEWFPFAYGLAGDHTGNRGARSWPRGAREQANYEGLTLRAKCSAYAQTVLSDLQIATPANPGYVEADDFCWLRSNWGSITEAAYDLDVPVPPEVEWLVTERSLPDALNLPVH